MSTQYSTFDVAEVQRQRLAALQASLRPADSTEDTGLTASSTGARWMSSISLYCQMAFVRVAHTCLPCFELLSLFTDNSEDKAAKEAAVEHNVALMSDGEPANVEKKKGTNKKRDSKDHFNSNNKQTSESHKAILMAQERRTRSTSSLLHNKRLLRANRRAAADESEAITERRESSQSLQLSRDLRESSVHSRSSLDTSTLDTEETVMNKAGSMSSLTSARSESMASVYSTDRFGTVSVKGEIELGFLYSLNSQSLEVAVRQCRDLAAVDIKRQRSDPYVKIYLLPDRSKGGKRKTKVKRHTVNPVFDEILRFQMPRAEVERRVLWLSVWHSDMFGRNDFLGELSLVLANQMLDDPVPKWFALHEHDERSLKISSSINPIQSNITSSESNGGRGELVLALKFVSAPSESATVKRNPKTKGMLMVLIKEAKQLVSNKANLDPFCKCYLLPEKSKSHKQKTGVCRKTSQPKWEHTVVYESVSLADLADRSLEVNVWHHDRLGHNELIGGARFNLGNGKHQGKPSMWMDATGSEVRLWQQMLERANFWVEGAVNLRPPERMRTSLPVL